MEPTTYSRKATRMHRNQVRRNQKPNRTLHATLEKEKRSTQGKKDKTHQAKKWTTIQKARRADRVYKQHLRMCAWDQHIRLLQEETHLRLNEDKRTQAWQAHFAWLDQHLAEIKASRNIHLPTNPLKRKYSEIL